MSEECGERTRREREIWRQERDGESRDLSVHQVVRCGQDVLSVAKKCSRSQGLVGRVSDGAGQGGTSSSRIRTPRGPLLSLHSTVKLLKLALSSRLSSLPLLSLSPPTNHRAIPPFLLPFFQVKLATPRRFVRTPVNSYWRLLTDRTADCTLLCLSLSLSP